MSTFDPTEIGTHEPYRVRTATAQATTGQTDWIRTPNWARHALFYFDFTGMAGTTPVFTPSILVAEPVTLSDAGLGQLKVVEHTAFTGMTTVGVNEVQTLTLSAGLATETFTLTNGGVASSAVTIPTGGYANVTASQIKTALLTIPAFSGGTNDIPVVKTSNDYAITFSGQLGNTDIGDTTVTNKTGAADGSVAETTKGVAGAGLVVAMGPGITGIADDVTNSATARAYVSLNTVLPPVVGLKVTNDRTTGNETYSYTVTAYFRH